MSTAPLLVSVDSSVSPKDCGTPGTSYQIVNYSTVDAVWISDNPSVRTNVGMPLQPQSAITVSYPHLYAILDNSATGPVTIIIGASIQDWSPSPVKNVTVSGPVNATVTGTVDINAGNVSVVNQPGVFPLTSLTQVLNNSAIVPGGWIQNIFNLQVYTSIIIQVQYLPPSSSFSHTTFNLFNVQGKIGGISGISVFNQSYCQQGSVGYEPGNLTNGDNTFTVIPLNGVDTISLSGTLSPALASMTINAWGTNALLSSSHRSQYPRGNLVNNLGPWWWNSNLRLSVPTGTSLFIPIPITSNGVTINLFSSGTGTGTTSSTVTVVDSQSNVLRSFIDTNVPKSTVVGPIVLPNSLPPQYLQIDESGASATSRWEILMQENDLALAA